MIDVHIEYMGFLQVEGVKNDSLQRVPRGITSRQLLMDWNIKESQHRFFTPWINGEKKSLDTPLKQGDKLFLYLPVGGG